MVQHEQMYSQAIAPTFLLQNKKPQTQLVFSGHWLIHQTCPSLDSIVSQLQSQKTLAVTIAIDDSFIWDSIFMSRLYPLQLWCQQQNIELDCSALPSSANQLLQVATAVAPSPKKHDEPSYFSAINLSHGLKRARKETEAFIRFIGEISISISRLCRGQANTRGIDFIYFVQQAGPNAIGIIGLTSVLIGMILAYLGLVQLRLLGAEIYIANLVTIGMMREMGALMTAVVMAGRTGAAYAAQLGTMQANEEIDALTTLGISPIEFLVLPRMLALICVMPLLCLFSNMMGLLGGGLVSMGMDITFNQYITQTQEAVVASDVFTGLFKSLVFAVLIAIAGCQAGIQSGRNSAAVGKATTKAVVTAIVYLIIADAVLNIIFSRLGI
ncbi:MAG: ABC transporter permease [Spongiibacteraceae bacterium]